MKDVNCLFVLGLPDMPYSGHLHVFLFYECKSPHEVCVSLVVLFHF